jgi:hypothetical protein
LTFSRDEMTAFIAGANKGKFDYVIC